MYVDVLFPFSLQCLGVKLCNAMCFLILWFTVTVSLFVRWSMEFGAPKTGSPELHVMLAEYMYSESPEMVSFD